MNESISLLKEEKEGRGKKLLYHQFNRTSSPQLLLFFIFLFLLFYINKKNIERERERENPVSAAAFSKSEMAEFTAQEKLIVEDELHYIYGVEDGENFCVKLASEIVEKGSNLLIENYLERKLVPYTVGTIVNQITSIVQFLYIQKDPGEPRLHEDSSWKADDGDYPLFFPLRFMLL